MKHGSISELGCDGIRRRNSISDRLVYLRSVGCGNISHHCDGIDGDYQILIRYRLVARFDCIRTIQKIRHVHTGGY